MPPGGCLGGPQPIVRWSRLRLSSLDSQTRTRTCLQFRQVSLVSRGFSGLCHLPNPCDILPTCLLHLDWPLTSVLQHLPHRTHFFLPTAPRGHCCLSPPLVDAGYTWAFPLPYPPSVLDSAPQIHLLSVPTVPTQEPHFEPEDGHDLNKVSWNAMLTSPIPSAHSSQSEVAKANRLPPMSARSLLVASRGSKNKVKPDTRASACGIPALQPVPVGLGHSPLGPVTATGHPSTPQACQGMPADHSRLLPCIPSSEMPLPLSSVVAVDPLSLSFSQI